MPFLGVFEESWKLGDGRRKTEDRRQKTGDGRQKLGDRRRKREVVFAVNLVFGFRFQHYISPK